ncbi:MAG: hypothetical protein NVSMB66_7060 [Candidatus Doudnabacteria bacterium]
MAKTMTGKDRSDSLEDQIKSLVTSVKEKGGTVKVEDFTEAGVRGVQLTICENNRISVVYRLFNRHPEKIERWQVVRFDHHRTSHAA